MRIAWRTVGQICERVMIEAERAAGDRLERLRRLGFDEISVRRGQRYITVVVDHDTGHLVWAHPGQDIKTVEKFLDLLGKDRCQRIELISCDMAEWIAMPIAERCPNAIRCLDPYHVVALATVALDDVRRTVWNEARRAGQRQLARELKGARFALWKNPDRLTERQQLKLARIQQLNKPLYRAYLLAQQLREIYHVRSEQATVLLDAWLNWARRSRLPAFIKLAKTITLQRAGIEAAIQHGLSNSPNDREASVSCGCVAHDHCGSAGWPSIVTAAFVCDAATGTGLLLQRSSSHPSAGGPRLAPRPAFVFGRASRGSIARTAPGATRVSAGRFASSVRASDHRPSRRSGPNRSARPERWASSATCLLYRRSGHALGMAP